MQEGSEAIAVRDGLQDAFEPDFAMLFLLEPHTSEP